jgi:CBS-domain-containing membrane protein
MKVKDVMTPEAKACWLTESLADAAKVMWENDCGILPVIKDGRKVVGLITDRDICMAAAMHERSPSGISVEEVMSGALYAAGPDDDIHQALATMKEHKIRRLPVIDSEGGLKGILSMNDIVLKAREPNGKKAPQLAYADVIKTYKAICAHPVPMASAAGANSA